VVPACQFKFNFPTTLFARRGYSPKEGIKQPPLIIVLPVDHTGAAKAAKNFVVNLHWRAILLENTAIFQLKSLNL